MSELLKIILIVVGGLVGMYLLVEIIQTTFFKFLWSWLVHAVFLGILIFNIDDFDDSDIRKKIISYVVIIFLFSYVLTIYSDFLLEKWWKTASAFIIVLATMAIFTKVGIKINEKFALVIGTSITAILCTLLLTFTSGKSINTATENIIKELSKPLTEEEKDSNYWRDASQY